MSVIKSIAMRDARFPIGSGHGSDGMHPVRVENGVYHTPQEAGASCDLKAD